MNKWYKSILPAVLILGILPMNGVKANAIRPNVIFILADDLGYSDVGFNGSTDIKTPNIDALANAGVIATNGYVSASICSPSRAGLMTGRYQQRFGHENNPPFDPSNAALGLPLSETTVAEVMKSAGYATGAIGKWHLGAHPIFHPNNRGFDEFFGFLGGQHNYAPSLGTDGDDPIQRDGVTVAETSYLTTAFGREAVDFVTRHRKGPFFLYLAFNAPHAPLQAPQKYLDRYPNISDPTHRTFAAMVSAMDDAVGALSIALSKLGLTSNTLVVFLSDNGGQLANGATNRPLKGGKGSLFEGGIRVPFFFTWPKHLPSGARRTVPLSSLDLLPTAAALAGADLPAKPRDGIDILRFLRGSAPSPRDLYWRMGGGALLAIRSGHWKLLNGGEVRTLYDLGVSPPEKTNVYGQSSIANRLNLMLSDWTSELVPPRW